MPARTTCASSTLEIRFGSGLGFLLFVVMMAFYIAIAVIVMVVITPLTLRAALTQEFGRAFNFPFIKRFIALTWKERLVPSAVVWAPGFVTTGAWYTTA